MTFNHSRFNVKFGYSIWLFSGHASRRIKKTIYVLHKGVFSFNNLNVGCLVRFCKVYVQSAPFPQFRIAGQRSLRHDAYCVEIWKTFIHLSFREFRKNYFVKFRFSRPLRKSRCPKIKKAFHISRNNNRIPFPAILCVTYENVSVVVDFYK